MINSSHISNPFETSGISPPVPPATAKNQHADDEDRKHNYVREGFQNRTRGEKKFNITTYFGMGYVGVWAFSLFTSWLLRDSRLVAPTYEKGVQAVTKATAAALSKSPEAIEGSMRKYMNISSLFTGGTLVSVLPIKWREDHKYEIVKKYDEQIYGKDIAENDPTIRAAHEQIRRAPQQTWSSVFASRLTSFIVTYTSAKMVGTQIENKSTQFGRWSNRKLTNNPETLAHINNAQAAHPHELSTIPGAVNADTVTTRIGHDAVADGMYTVLTSGALYVFTRIFAPLFDQRHKFEEEQHKTAHKAAPVIENTPVAGRSPDDGLPGPSAQVSAVKAQARVATAPAEHSQGA